MINKILSNILSTIISALNKIIILDVIQNQFPRGASASRHSSSPEIEEVQFGRKLGGADTRQQPAQHVPEPTPVPQPLHALKPGNLQP